MWSEDRAPRLDRVAVLGLGLMGGSLARALRGLEGGPEVVGWSPSASEADAALAAGGVSAIVDAPSAAAEAADLVVLATPLGAACALVETLAGALAPGATLTDLSSLKTPVADAVRRAGLEARWVGSHPMCGGERSGFEASRADLYRDAWIWLVEDGAEPDARARVRALWRALGARPNPIDASAHDVLMARVSHLPQLTANALGVLLDEADLMPGDLGPGGRDMTRLAASSPTMWRDILGHAPAALPEALRDLSERLASLADLVETRDMEALEAWMAATRRWREGS